MSFFVKIILKHLEIISRSKTFEKMKKKKRKMKNEKVSWVCLALSSDTKGIF